MKDRISKDVVQAMKDKNTIARDILKVLKGEIERGGKVTTDAEIVKKVKKLIDSIELSGNDNGEIAILEKYLPEQLSSEDIALFAKTFIKVQELSSPRDMGKVMGYFKQNFEGTYDGKVLSTIVKDLLV